MIYSESPRTLETLAPEKGGDPQSGEDLTVSEGSRCVYRTDAAIYRRDGTPMPTLKREYPLQSALPSSRVPRSRAWYLPR